jgi:hypothetical protein
MTGLQGIVIGIFIGVTLTVLSFYIYEKLREVE